MLVNSSAAIEGEGFLTAYELMEILVKVPDHALVGVCQGGDRWRVTAQWEDER